MSSCECGNWDEVHGARQALINSAHSEMGRNAIKLLDPHDNTDRRIIMSLYAIEARVALSQMSGG